MSSFPSARSRELYDACQGRLSLVDVGLKTSEQVEFLESPRGKRGLWMDSDLGAGIIIGGLSAVSLISTVAVFCGGTGMLTADILPSEVALAGAGLLGIFGGGASFSRTVSLLCEVQDAKEDRSRTELLRSIARDLQDAGYDVLSADETTMSFTTQRGLVVAGEDRHGELTLLLDGSPMRVSYEAAGSASTEFITSMNGERVTMNKIPHIVF